MKRNAVHLLGMTASCSSVCIDLLNIAKVVYYSGIAHTVIMHSILNEKQKITRGGRWQISWEIIVYRCTVPLIHTVVGFYQRSYFCLSRRKNFYSLWNVCALCFYTICIYLEWCTKLARMKRVHLFVRI